jgi:hypothetical protein
MQGIYSKNTAGLTENNNEIYDKLIYITVCKTSGVQRN